MADEPIRPFPSLLGLRPNTDACAKLAELTGHDLRPKCWQSVASYRQTAGTASKMTPPAIWKTLAIMGEGRCLLGCRCQRLQTGLRRAPWSLD